MTMPTPRSWPRSHSPSCFEAAAAIIHRYLPILVAGYILSAWTLCKQARSCSDRTTSCRQFGDGFVSACWLALGFWGWKNAALTLSIRALRICHSLIKTRGTRVKSFFSFSVFLVATLEARQKRHEYHIHPRGKEF
jgi:hypothetical protein